tara:strand:- start:161 stop:1177 length:1017 start_codon:yes stop_codon:yes gene_type:complete
VLGKRISKEEFYKRYPKPSKDELLEDPDTRESMSAELTKFLNDRYALYRELGASHEDATIESRRDAGVAADALTKVGAQNQQNANIFMDNRGKYDDVNKLLEFVEAAKEPYSERANEVRRQNAMALDNLIESVRTELGVYGPYNKESIDNQSSQMDRRTRRRSSADSKPMANYQETMVDTNKNYDAMANETMRRFRARNPKQEAATPEEKAETFLDMFMNVVRPVAEPVGKALLDADQYMADKFRGAVKGDSDMAAFRRDAQGMSIRDINKKVAAMGQPESQAEAFLKPAMVAMPYATNLATRSLPVLGGTLATKALIDFTAALSPADYQEQGQIRMS